MKRSKSGIKLHQFMVSILFLNGKTGTAGAQGNAATWVCACEYITPLLGRSSVQFGRGCYTVCPERSWKYKVRDGLTRRIHSVEEII